MRRRREPNDPPQPRRPGREVNDSVVGLLGMSPPAHMLATMLVFGAVACFSGVFGTLLMRSARAQTLLNRVAGLVFLGLAVRLATAQRN